MKPQAGGDKSGAETGKARRESGNECTDQNQSEGKGVRHGLRKSGLRSAAVQWPVDPKPPPPLSVSSSMSTDTILTCVTDAMTIWAIRIPRSTLNGS